MISFCLVSLVLIHHRLPIFVASFDKKNSGEICCHISEPIFKFLFFLRLFSYKFLAEFNMHGKTTKDGKTKAGFLKKKICNAIVISFNFLLRVY